MNDYILQTSKLGIGHQNILVENISFAWLKGDIIHLTGDNGRGKSTLIQTILGLIPAKSGDYQWGVSPSSIAYLPQEFMRPTHWSINMGEIDQLFHLTQSNTPLGLLFSQASGGQRQKKILDVLIAEGKEILILDEPFNHVDLKTQDEILSYLFTQIKTKKIAGVLITGHFKHEKLRIIELC